MTAHQIQWSKEEFLVYLLLYAAHADNKFTEEEKNYILSKIDKEGFQKIFEEFSVSNDYQHLQKIISYRKIYQFHPPKKLLDEIQHLFLVDNDFHYLEKILYMGIRHVL